MQGKKELVIGFDLDGTLIDNLWIQLIVINYLRNKRGLLQIDLITFQNEFKNWRDFRREISLPPEDSEISREYFETLKFLILENKPLFFNGAKELLRFLREGGARLFLVTAQKPEIIEIYKSYLGDFTLFFDEIMSVDQKINKRETLEQIKKQEGEEKDFYFVSDTVEDLIDAQMADWFAIGVPNGYSSKENLEEVIRLNGNGEITGSLWDIKFKFENY